MLVLHCQLRGLHHSQALLHLLVAADKGVRDCRRQASKITEFQQLGALTVPCYLAPCHGTALDCAHLCRLLLLACAS